MQRMICLSTRDAIDFPCCARRSETAIAVYSTRALDVPDVAAAAASAAVAVVFALFCWRLYERRIREGTAAAHCVAVSKITAMLPVQRVQLLNELVCCIR